MKDLMIPKEYDFDNEGLFNLIIKGNNFDGYLRYFKRTARYFLCVIKNIKENNYNLDFDIYQVLGEENDTLIFQNKEAMSSPSGTSLLDQAEVTLSGFVKWDGCMNFNFEPDTTNEGMSHICGHRYAVDIMELIQWPYHLYQANYANSPEVRLDFEI